MSGSSSDKGLGEALSQLLPRLLSLGDPHSYHTDLQLRWHGRAVPLQRYVAVRPRDGRVDRTRLHRVHPRSARGTRGDPRRRRHVHLWRARRRREGLGRSRGVQDLECVLVSSSALIDADFAWCTALMDLNDLCRTDHRWFMFQNMGPAPSGRSGHSMATHGSKVFVLGGESYTSGRVDDPSLVHILDTSTSPLARLWLRKSS